MTYVYCAVRGCKAEVEISERAALGWGELGISRGRYRGDWLLCPDHAGTAVIAIERLIGRPVVVGGGAK